MTLAKLNILLAEKVLLKIFLSFFEKVLDKRFLLWYNGRALKRKVSSVGRASALQAEGHRFEPCTFHQEHEVFVRFRKLNQYIGKAC